MTVGGRDYSARLPTGTDCWAALASLLRHYRQGSSVRSDTPLPRVQTKIACVRSATRRAIPLRSVQLCRQTHTEVVYLRRLRRPRILRLQFEAMKARTAQPELHPRVPNVDRSAAQHPS